MKALVLIHKIFLVGLLYFLVDYPIFAQNQIDRLPFKYAIPEIKTSFTTESQFQAAFPFQQIENISGIPVYINSIKKDNQGFLWLGSKDGIYRYDGI